MANVIEHGEMCVRVRAPGSAKNEMRDLAQVRLHSSRSRASELFCGLFMSVQTVFRAHSLRHAHSLFLPPSRSLARSLARFSLSLPVCVSVSLSHSLSAPSLSLLLPLSFARSRAGRTLEQQEARASPEGVTGRAPC